MNSSLGIYFQRHLLQEITFVKKHLEKVFPQLSISIIGEFEIQEEAFDTSKGQYDVHYLLENFKNSPDFSYGLWVMENDISDFWHSFLFGAVSNGKGIVSKARLNDWDCLAKEACHEVGHLIGLEHCKNICLMQPSATDEEVKNKGSCLCESCKKVLTQTHSGTHQMLSWDDMNLLTFTKGE